MNNTIRHDNNGDFAVLPLNVQDSQTGRRTKPHIRIIIAGGRDFTDLALLEQKLNELTENLGELTVISGTAKGADRLGEIWAAKRHHSVLRMPADWNRHGNAAGYRRNEEMANIATHCVCFWNGTSRGTSHMIAIAKRKGLPLRIVNY